MKKKSSMTKHKDIYLKDVHGARRKFGAEVIIGNKPYFCQREGRKTLIWEIEDMDKFLESIGEI